MKNYLDNMGNFSDEDNKQALDEYIIFHNVTLKSSTKYTPNDIRDLNNQELISHTLLDNLNYIYLIKA